MKHTFKVMMICGLSMLAACGKKATDENGPENPEQKPGTETEMSGPLLPVSLESKTLKIQLKYLENTAELIQLTGSDGYRLEITWKDGLPVSYTKYHADRQYELVDYQKSSAVGPRLRRFSLTGSVSSFTGTTYTLTYKGQLLESLKYYSNNVLDRQLDMTYNEGNCTGIREQTADGALKEWILKYDTGKGMFSNLRLAERILLEFKYDFLKPGSQNPVSIEATGSENNTTSYRYTYAASGYPEEMILKSGKTEQRFKVTYAELKNGAAR